MNQSGLQLIVISAPSPEQVQIVFGSVGPRQLHMWQLAENFSHA